jgi:hypothetical protein
VWVVSCKFRAQSNIVWYEIMCSKDVLRIRRVNCVHRTQGFVFIKGWIFKVRFVFEVRLRIRAQSNSLWHEFFFERRVEDTPSKLRSSYTGVRSPRMMKVWHEIFYFFWSTDPCSKQYFVKWDLFSKDVWRISRADSVHRSQGSALLFGRIVSFFRPQK